LENQRSNGKLNFDKNLNSGTLHPMDALLSELGSDFNRRLRRVSNNSDAPVRVVFEHSLSQ